MALATESANLVRQKTRAITRNPGVFYALKALFLHLATNKGNPDLQFVHIDGTLTEAAGGQDHGVDAACKVYAVWLKKTNTATDAYYVLFDDATDDSGGNTDARITLPTLLANEEVFAIYPDGLDMAAGLVSKSYTTNNGTIDTAAGNAAHGFLLVGAA